MREAQCAEAQSKTDPWDGQPPQPCDATTVGYQLPAYSQIDGSIVIDNYLVSLGQAGVEIHSLDKLATRLAKLRWPSPMARATDVITSVE